MKDVVYSEERSAFSRLQSGSVTDEYRQRCRTSRCNSLGWNSTKPVTHDSIQHSLALAGLERAVKATHQSTRCLHQAAAAFEEVRKANISAAEAEVFAVEAAASLVDNCSFGAHRRERTSVKQEDNLVRDQREILLD